MRKNSVVSSVSEVERNTHAFSTSFAGWIMKRGHQVKNWKNRYFVVKGCTVSYFDDEISDSKVLFPESLAAMKGSHLITSVEETKEESGLGWRINTEQGKEFSLRGHNENSRRDAIDAMKKAADIYADKMMRFPQDMSPKLLLALQLIEYGALVLAIPILQQLVNETSPSSSAAALYHYHLGTALLTSGDASAAVSSLSNALDIQNGQYDDAEVNLAAARTVLGDLSAAKQHLRNVLQRSNNNIAAAHNLANLLVSERAYEEAQELLSYALQCDAATSSLYVCQAEVQYMMGQPSAAIDTLRSGLVHCSRSSDIYTRLGQMLLSNNEEHAGIAHLQEAVDINPKNTEAVYLLEMAVKRREEDSELPFDEWMANTLQEQMTVIKREEDDSIATAIPATGASFSVGSAKPEKRQSIFGSIFSNNKNPSSQSPINRRGSSFA